MKKILLPTDFSQNAINAIHYALELFKDEVSVALQGSKGSNDTEGAKIDEHRGLLRVQDKGWDKH